MKQLRSDSDNNSQKFVVCEQGDSSNFTQQKIHQGVCLTYILSYDPFINIAYKFLRKNATHSLPPLWPQ